MSRKFKYRAVVVTGDLHLVEAFAKKAVEIGYSKPVGLPANVLSLYYDASQGYHRTTETTDKQFSLPQDWDQASIAIAETPSKEGLVILGYPAEIKQGGVAFGCQSFTLSELEAYRRLYNHPVYGAVHIGTRRITLEELNSLIDDVKNYY